MNNHYAKIRAALELADNFDDAYSTSSERDAKNDAMAAAITALTELERMAGEPVAWRRDGFTFFVGDGWDVPPDGAFPLYAAPPIPKGMFAAKEMEAAYIEGCLTAGSPWLPSALFKRSNTFKLVQERTK